MISLLAADQRTRRLVGVGVDILGLVEAGTDEDRHVVHHAEFNRTDLQHLGALRGQLQHVFEGDPVEPARLRDYPRVGGVDPVDVGVDIAAVGMDGGGHRNRGGVGTAAPERGDSPRLRIDALEAGDHSDLLAFPETVDQFGTIDLENPRRCMGVTGFDRDLPALPGTRLNADRLQRNRQQPGRDLFAGRHDGVIFARIVHRRGFAAPFHQFIGLAGHRRHHHGDVMAGIDLALHV